MCLKPPAEGDYLSGELVFLDLEQLSGTGVQEHMAHLLSHPLTLPPPPRPLVSFSRGLGKMPAPHLSNNKKKYSRT